jgi:peptidoglycan-N-acetylglucosamine deacetylase
VEPGALPGDVRDDTGATAIRWTVDTLGWEGTARGQTTGSVTSRVLAALRPGDIVLMHVGSPPDGSTLDANALPRIIRAIRHRGYSFVAITDFLPTH